MADARQNPRFWQVFRSGFQGISGISRVHTASSAVIFRVGLFCALVGVAVLALAIAYFFPHYEDVTFLLLEPLLPLQMLVGLFLLNCGLKVIFPRSIFRLDTLFFVSGQICMLMSVMLALVIVALYFQPWSSIIGSLFLLMLISGGISWTALQLHHLWVALLNFPPGWATVLAGFSVAAIQGGSLYIWMRYIVEQFLLWNNLVYLD